MFRFGSVVTLCRHVRWAYQRVVRGYDDRITWDFSVYFERIIDPLEEFCLKHVDDETFRFTDPDLEHLNSEQTEVFRNTLRLINRHKEAVNSCDFYSSYYDLSSHEWGELWGYVAENIAYFWD